MERLLGLGADAHARGATGYTPLYLACMHGHASIAQRLVKAGADIQKLTSSLHVASSRNHLKVAECLIQAGADIHARDFEGRTPLHEACLWERRDIATLLLRAGADAFAVDNRGTQPAAGTKNEPIKRLLGRTQHIVLLLINENIPKDLIREFSQYI